jgi:MFS family permease
MAIIPSLVAKEDLFMANSLVSITAMIAAILGFGLGGMIVEKWGVKTAFILDACTFFISAILIFFMRLEETSMFKAKDIIELGKNALHKVKNSFIFEIKEGIKYLVGAKETRYATKIFFVIFSCIGAIYPIFIVFVQETFSSVTADLGWLAVSSGAGLFLGSVFYGRFGSKFSVKKTVNFSLIFAGAYLIFFVWFLKNNPNKIFALFSCFLMGLISSPMVIAINTLIHKESKNELWGRIFSSLEVVIHLAFIIFMFISAYLAEKFSTFTIIVAVGIIMFLFSFFNIFRDND